MRTGRKVLIIAAVLAVVVAATLIILWTNIDWIVKAAIERYGSEATKTAVRVSSVTIHLTSGEGAISGLTVANPRGFFSPYAVRLGTISAKLDTHTVATSPVVLKELRIAAPQVVYEVNPSGASNIAVLKKNIQGAAAAAPKKAQTGKKAGDKGTKIVIRKLVIENGRIDVRVAALGDRPQTVTMRRIELTNIGKQGGATPSEVAEQVLTALVEEVGSTVVRSGIERSLEKGVEGAVRQFLGKPR